MRYTKCLKKRYLILAPSPMYDRTSSPKLSLESCPVYAFQVSCKCLQMSLFSSFWESFKSFVWYLKCSWIANFVEPGNPG